MTEKTKRANLCTLQYSGITFNSDLFWYAILGKSKGIVKYRAIICEHRQILEAIQKNRLLNEIALSDAAKAFWVNIEACPSFNDSFSWSSKAERKSFAQQKAVNPITLNGLSTAQWCQVSYLHHWVIYFLHSSLKVLSGSDEWWIAEGASKVVVNLS